MNIVITAGGTSESIDKVRKITNSGTGKLGAIIADKFASKDNIQNIYYIHTPKAHLPKTNKVICIQVTDTLSVKNAVESILTSKKIDIFIHSMAISDYYVDYVSTIHKLANELKDSKNIEETLMNPKNKLDNQSKLSSNEENMIVVLKQTPKIIKIIKELSPNTILIGFKLLENVTKEYLISVAYELMNKNKCDYVVANDLKNIKNGNHKAFLLNNENDVIEINGKEEIANILFNILFK